MGGNFISLMDDDPSLAFQNPALLNPSMNNHLSLNTVDYISDINYGYAGFVHSFDTIKTTFNAGIQYIHYGSFNSTDAVGNTSGTFNGSEYAISIGAGREYTERFYYGASITFITSHLESYTSNGAALTLAGAYHDAENGLTASVLFKNVGTQFKSYIPGNHEPLPFDIEAGISKRLIHTPFLFSLVFHDLQKFDIRYNDPNELPGTTIVLDSSRQVKSKNYIADKIFLHCIFGAEIYVGKNVRLNLSYNHQRRQELAYELHKGLSGFSFGANVRINRFNIGYGRSIYNDASGINHLTVGINFDDWFGKKM